MKISCEIIKDLLPLYIDDVCSKESQEIVEEHLLECSVCKEMLEKMNMDIEVNKYKEKENLIDAAQLKSLSIKWNKKMMFNILKGIGFGILLSAITLIVLSIFIGIKIG